MSKKKKDTHKNPTISFRISPQERQELEAKIFVSGLMKKTYFTQACLNSQVVVIGTKEQVDKIVNQVQKTEKEIKEMVQHLEQGHITTNVQELKELKAECVSMLKAVIWVLGGAKSFYK